MVVRVAPRPRAHRQGGTGAGRTRWRVIVLLAMVALVVTVAALRGEGFETEARLLHLAGWSLLAALGLSDGARRLRGGAGALGDGRSRLDQCLGLLQAGISVAMLLGLLPFPG